MAHLAGKQLMALLRLFPSGHIDKNAEHDPADNAGVVALTARGYPSHVVPKHDAKVDFVRFKNRPRGSKSRPHAVPVGRMNTCGEIFEYYGGASWYSPQIECAVIHSQLISIDVPGPKSDPCCFYREMKVLGRQLDSLTMHGLTLCEGGGRFGIGAK